MKSKNKSKLIILILIALGLVSLRRPLAAGSKSALDWVRFAEDVNRGETSYGKMSMTIQKARFTRKMSFESWERRKTKEFFIRILEPVRDKGTTFLKRGEQLWQYLPQIGREVKVEGSMMQSSWMGSDFSNDDLVKDTSVIEDYKHSIESESASQVCIRLTPKTYVPVVWKHIIGCITKANGLYSTQDFYNQRGELMRKMKFTQVKKIGGRIMPSIMTVQTIRSGRVDSTTTMEYEQAKFNIGISKFIFSKANLRR